MLLLQVIFLCSLYTALPVLGFQCRDHSNNPVDWYVIYKLPELKDNPNPLIQTGYGHVYLDVNNPTWQLSNVSVAKPGQALYYTLQPIYAEAKNTTNHSDNDYMYAFYNDEKPEGGFTNRFGHSKGVVAFEKSGGFWLVHSVPRFPPRQNNSYGYPHSGRLYGQTFLCISLTFAQMNTVATQFTYNFPMVYDFTFPASFHSASPVMDKYLHDPNNTHVTGAPWYNQVTLKSLAGTTFMSFAKFTRFDDDLYAAMVAPSLKVGLDVESWQQNGDILYTNCSTTYRVYNVANLSILANNFTERQDHAKWAISLNEKQPWVCIGDINRMVHQMKRAGGTVCFTHAAVWSQFKADVVQCCPCPTQDNVWWLQDVPRGPTRHKDNCGPPPLF